MSSPELAVRQLARLPSNCTCPNCGTWSRYGFSSVCMKYLTFVCDKCKSSHQAISHRCKSLTMSSWDHGEALKLKVHGNDYARKVWLATAPPPGVGGRPREGDDIDVFKRFVVDAYEQRRYYRDPSSSDGEDRAKDVTGTAESVIDAPSTKVSSSMSSTTSVHIPSSSVAPIVVDLLDFGAFDTPALPPASVADLTPPVATSSDAFFDPFNNDSASLMADVSSQPTSTAKLNNLTSSFNNNSCNNSANQTNNIMSFDAFAPSMVGTVMSNNMSSMQSNKFISDSFSVLASPPATSSRTDTWGMTPTNPSNVSNFSTSSNMINGCTPNFTNNNMMMTTTTMVVNGGGGMVNNGNGMMINGNFNMMNVNKPMMMNGGSNNNMMHNGGANAAMMMSNSGGVMSSNMAMSRSMQQQFYQSTIMNSHAGSPMLNTIPVSNNISATPAGDMKTAVASARSNGTKPDPFAGLMGL